MSIVEHICIVLDVDYQKTISKSRARDLVEHRNLIAKYLKEERYTFQKIAEMIGRKDHATAMHAIASYDEHQKGLERWDNLLAKLKSTKPSGQLKPFPSLELLNANYVLCEQPGNEMFSYQVTIIT